MHRCSKDCKYRYNIKGTLVCVKKQEIIKNTGKFCNKFEKQTLKDFILSLFNL